MTVPKVFHTVGAISAGFFTGYLKRAKLTRKKFYGRDHSNFNRFERFAVDAFHGGRNESLCVGHIKKRLCDLDLSGAYSIGMAHIPVLDFSRAIVTTKLESFLGVNVVGFVEARFQFPQDVLVPCLPVKTKRGLIYPISGVTYCTAYELTLAVRLGAVVHVESGLIIPAKGGQEEPVLKRFVRDIRSERSKHAKGSLYNGFYKLILNSLYGKFAQGVSPKKYFNARTGLHEASTCDVNTNPYFAALITGFIRTVLSELAHELTHRGFLVVSMTTDGLLTDATREFILNNVDTPFLGAFKALVEDSGGRSDEFLEEKGHTDNLFSWKTRGQYALDGGSISALAGLQKPPGSPEFVSSWVMENVANDRVKCLNQINRITSLVEVYKGSPFGNVSVLKYISTQFDFKRCPVPYEDTCIRSKPWADTKAMDLWEKRYVSPFPYKVNTERSLRQFDAFIEDIEARRKVERRRNRRLECGYRVDSLLPTALRQCARSALQGAAGFSRKYSSREVVHYLRTHGIGSYQRGKVYCEIDSNFCKNQARLPIAYNRLPLSVDVLRILDLFTKLDPSFDPCRLLLNEAYILQLSTSAIRQLDSMRPLGVEHASWVTDYLRILSARVEDVGREGKPVRKKKAPSTANNA